MRIRMYWASKVVQSAWGPLATPDLTRWAVAHLSAVHFSASLLFEKLTYSWLAKNDYLPKIRRTKKRSQIFPDCGGFSDQWVRWESKHSLKNFRWMGCLRLNRLFAKRCAVIAFIALILCLELLLNRFCLVSLWKEFSPGYDLIKVYLISIGSFLKAWSILDGIPPRRNNFMRYTETKVAEAGRAKFIVF